MLNFRVAWLHYFKICLWHQLLDVIFMAATICSKKLFLCWSHFHIFGGSKKDSQAVNQGPLIEGNLILIFFSEAAISASNSEHQGVSNLRPVQTRCSSLHLIQWLQQRRDRKILISLQKCNRLSMTAADLRFSVKKPLSDSRPLWMQSFVL